MDLNASHKLVVPLIFLNSKIRSSNACEEDANKESSKKHQAVTGNNIEGEMVISEDGSDKSNI